MVMTKLVGTNDRSTTEIERLVSEAGGELRIVQSNLSENGSVTLIVYNPKTEQEISIWISSHDIVTGSPRHRIAEELAANTAAHARKTIAVKVEVLQKMVSDLNMLAQEITALIERKK